MQTHHARIVLTAQPYDWKSTLSEQDVHHQKYETLGIDEIRALITEAHRHATGANTTKHIVLAAHKITLEAQQAALKILEEPPASSNITLVLPLGTQLLPTVLSRIELEIEQEVAAESNTFPEWMDSSHQDRLQIIDKALKAKDTEWLQQFRNGLLSYTRSNPVLSVESMQTVGFVTENLLARGASNKMLLEHLALSLPLTR